MQYDMNVFTAKMYVAALRAHVKKAINYNLNNGIFPAKAPLGYLNYRDKNNNACIKLDEERAPKIKRLFLEYATGLHSAASLWELAKEMNLTTRATKKCKSHLISANKICDILNNPFYSGIMVVKGKGYPHKYDTIITPELFQKVKSIIKNKGKKVAVPHQQIYRKHPFTFRGLIKCGYCGCSMTPEEHTKKSGNKYRYLRCSHMKGECHQKPINEAQLLKQLDDEVFSKLQIPASILQALKKNVRMRLEEESHINARLKRENSLKLEELENKKERLLDVYLDGGLSKEEYQEEKAKVEEQKKALETIGQKHTVITTTIKETVERIVEIVGNLSHIMKTADPKIQNQILKLLLKNAVLEGDRLKYEIQVPFSAFMQIDAKEEISDYISTNLEEFNQIAHPIGLLANYISLTA